MKLTSPILSAWSFAVWVVTGMLAIGVIAALEYRAGLSELAEQSHTIDTLLAERLAQHDAHLSALGALLRMSPDEPSANIQGLAENIVARYPRIIEIATIRKDGEAAQVVTYGKQGMAGVENGKNSRAFPDLEKAGQIVVKPVVDQHAYDLFKLVEAGRLLRLRIDANVLIAPTQLPPQYSFRLSVGDAVLAANKAAGNPIMTAATTFDVSNPSQPLHLSLSRGFGLTELLPVELVLPVLVGLGAMTLLVALYRDASRQRYLQEQRAALLEHDAKLAHAGRVNALGEMASGIAHELAQPIAALLSQSQAARRAMAIGRPDILEQALDASIREARRAGDILGRMRAYISGAAAQMEKVLLADAITGALRLVESDIAQRGITLNVQVPDATHIVAIDVISFQQVVHNLVRNAVEAVANRPAPRIELSVRQEGQQMVITVADNGPGIEPLALQRIFEPFFTTKPDGMGLGLPLSARLIEAMDGTIDARNDGGACFTVRLPTGGIA